MHTPLDKNALNQRFNEARTHSYWQDKPLEDGVLEQLYALTALGPTSANCSPGRFVFVTSQEGKEKLKPALSSEQPAGRLSDSGHSLGLDAGPMSGFDPSKINEAFFAGSSRQVNMLVNLGYGNHEKLHPRLSFEQACKFA